MKSSAYNLSAHGPVIPLGADILALTPISAFRPRRWRGALLNADAHVEFDIMDGQKRPVAASADNQEIRNIENVKIQQDNETSLTLLFDPAHGLDEKLLVQRGHRHVSSKQPCEHLRQQVWPRHVLKTSFARCLPPV